MHTLLILVRRAKPSMEHGWPQRVPLRLEESRSGASKCWNTFTELSGKFIESLSSCRRNPFYPDALKVLIQPDQVPSGIFLLYQISYTKFLAQSKHFLSPDPSHEPYQAISGHIRKFGFLQHSHLGAANRGSEASGKPNRRSEGYIALRLLRPPIHNPQSDISYISEIIP